MKGLRTWPPHPIVCVCGTLSIHILSNKHGWCTHCGALVKYEEHEGKPALTFKMHGSSRKAHG